MLSTLQIKHCIGMAAKAPEADVSKHLHKINISLHNCPQS